MSLTLLTGPANAAKAGAILERLRAALPREPLLVVPTLADVEHYQRELAAGGIVFGAEVATFSRLVREIASKTGLSGRPLGRVARDRLVRAAIGTLELRALGASATSPGFAVAAGDLFAELQRSLVTPARFTQALRAWAGAEGAGAGDRAAYAEDLAALYSAYRRLLERHGWMDSEGHAWAALDALREQPASWGARPVFLYGFDDLTPLQLDAVETLVTRAETEVCVALPYEPGRAALAGCAATVETLKPIADRHLELEDRSEHYAPGSRGALHHLERSLFEPGAARRPPNGAVRLLEAGGERAEAELVGAEVLELMRQGVAPEDIAVLVRGQGAALIEQVLGTYGIPVANDRPTRLARTRLGAGVLAFARAALPDGTAEDLLTWLRTPGKLSDPDAADRLEAAVRRGEIASAAEARGLWEESVKTAGQPLTKFAAAAERSPGEPAVAERPLTELDELAAAAAEGVPELLAVLECEAHAIWTAPHRRRAALLGPEDRVNAAAAAALRQAASDLRGVAAADPALLAEPGDLIAELGRVRVWTPSEDEGAVLLADPLAIRARRFRAVFVCGLQHGEFPRHGVPEPFLGDDDRRELARASGLRLPPHEDVLARERSLFYAAVSRPEEVLFLSFRSSNEEGDPQQVSPFVEDVRDLFTDELWEQRGRRLLAEVTWPPRDAPTPQELRRALAAAAPEPGDPAPLSPPATDAVLALLAGRRREAARGLETFAACGVRWLVESMLRPQPIDPDPDPMRRGSLAHAVLERTLSGLRSRTGSARLTPERLPEALAELDRALSRLTPPGTRASARPALRALAVDLRRYLRREAEQGAGFEPAHLEWSFGREHDAAGPLRLGDGRETGSAEVAPGGGEIAGERDGSGPLRAEGRERVAGGLEVSGRVDRIDIGPGGEAIVRDYKGRTVHAGARWTEDQRLQVALYALAVRELLGLDPVAGLYQPLAGRELRPRGLVRDDVEGDYVRTDRVSEEEFESALSAARDLARTTAAALRAGRIRPCPQRCSGDRGCAYPTICRGGTS